jgi:hypothetical protein
MHRYIRAVLVCLNIWLGMLNPAMAWGPVGHAVIGELAEHDLLQDDPGLRTFLTRLREPARRQRMRHALLGLKPPEPGAALRVLANWPDWRRDEPGMFPFDRQRHYVNLPHRARYSRKQHCPDGLCSIETLLQQRAVLANRRAALPQRAVALAWVVHLVGDIHQPLHAGKAADRGGNLTCVTWRGAPSRPVIAVGPQHISGTNLHAVWDSKLIAAVTGFTGYHDAPEFARQLRGFLGLVRAAEPPLVIRTPADWRASIERWHRETQALILLDDIYPHGHSIGRAYIRSHFRTVRLQLLRAAVRLAALLRQTLRP